jgi:uridine kinase
MSEIISADRPFELRRVRTIEAIELFRSRGMEDKALLMETAGLTYTSYYEMDGYIDYFYGCLTPSSGYLTLFDLVSYEGGMLLRVPDRYSPTLLPALFPQEKMFHAYKESLRFQRTLGVSYVGELNRAVECGGARELILVSEALQEKQIAGMAEKIASKYAAGVRVILIAGPSSSGKTTFARRLGVQLLTNMLHPVSISLDDYYVDRSRTPLNEDGEPDYESLESIDLDLFKENLRSLISGMEVETPVYNFANGSRESRGRRLRLRDNSVILIEGIHGLNPALTSLLPIESIYRVYVSALTSISLDAHNWIPSSDNRLLRRIIRDHHMRGYSASETILMWDRIRAGEDRWIFPYAENADTTFNSAMIYEFGVMRSYAEPLLYGISELDAGYSESYRLLRFLRYFRRISLGDIPGTSLLREFLGGSNL